MIKYISFCTKLCSYILVGIYVCTSQEIKAQTDTTFNRINLTYENYMMNVLNHNLDFAAQKFNVSIADAQIEAARVFKDPIVAINWTGNKENISKNGFGVSSQITQTIELGQKRKARINFAKSQSEISEALLKDYLRNLQADATLDYMNALKQNQFFKVMLNSYQLMKKLADADSIRFNLGSIKSIDAIQSRIEAGINFNNLCQIASDRKNSLLKLSLQTSNFQNDSLFSPIETFEKIDRLYALNGLLAEALNNRADLLAAKLTILGNESQLILTKKERIADIDFTIGASNSYLGGGIYSPEQSTIFTGIAIPLKFSNANKSTLQIAKYQVNQSELVYKQLELKVQNSVCQSFNLYKSLCKQVDNFNKGLLTKAKDVLNAKIYSYLRGETSLLEVLNAQRTYNDLQLSYYQTVYDCNAALVELQRSVGIWDIEF